LVCLRLGFDFTTPEFGRGASTGEIDVLESLVLWDGVLVSWTGYCSMFAISIDREMVTEYLSKSEGKQENNV